MANSYTLLANLRAGRCSNTAEVRLLRFWEARNINKGGELMSLEMLLINEVEAGEVPQLAVPQTVAPGSEAIGAMKSNVAGEASTSDGPLGGRETAEEEQVDLEESAPKKARVE
ncbi:hypothetical protein Bca52824_009369 [Brassica carinata]|uniref:Uncharacterized protein n=1 Tax=Brassica carinata TaxID=52824 RepID=A0A8X7WAT1_BRACI|nr:hypothetical protein Bca52824_009369 [Brassica carinata]